MFRYILLGLAFFSLSGCASDNPKKVIWSGGYLTTAPPSTAFGPGNIVWKKNNIYNSKNDVSLGYICSPEFIKFPGKPEISSSEQINIKNNKTFKLTADNFDLIGLDASAEYVKAVTMTFSNTEMQEYALDKIQMITSRLGPECKKILTAQRKKANAFAVVSAFKADLSYQITYKANVSTKAKLQVMKELKAEFGIGLDGASGSVGKGLYYGVDLQPVM